VEAIRQVFFGNAQFMAGTVIRLSWLAFGVYWFFSALRVKRLKRREPMAQRLAYLLAIVFAAVILYAPGPFVFLQRRFVPRISWVESLGASLTVAGVAFAIWARVHIGQYWSATVALREGHQLIRTGPYAHIRHPIYSGVLLALAGTCLSIGTYRAISLLGVILAGFTIKAKREEALLAGEFGPAFDEHRSHTGFFLPKLS
jgi:protein-S-isoprenylcysteine O-methyltransferase Ste14